MPGCLALLARFGAGTCGRAPAATDEEGELIRFGVALRRGGDTPAQRVGRGAADGLVGFGASSGAGGSNRLIPVIALDASTQAQGVKEDGVALSAMSSGRGSGTLDRSRIFSSDVELGLPPANPRASRRGPLTSDASAAAAAAAALPQGTSTAVTVSPAVGAAVPPAWMPRPARGVAPLAPHAGEDREGTLRRPAPHDDRDGAARRASTDAREDAAPGRVPPPVVVTGSSASLSGALASRSRSQSPLYAAAAAGWKVQEAARREGLAQTAAQLQVHAAGAPAAEPRAAPVPSATLLPPHVLPTSRGYAPSTYVSCAPVSPPPSSTVFGSYPLASGAMSAVAAAAASVAAAASAAAAAAASAAAGGAGADAWLWRSPSRFDMSAEIASANARAQSVSRSLSHATSDASLDLEGLPEGLAALRPQQHALAARAGAASSSTASLQSLPSLHRAMHGVSSSATLQAQAGFAEAGRDGPRACSGGVPLPGSAAAGATPAAAVVPNWPAGPRADPPPPLPDERVPFAAPGLAMRAVATRPPGKAPPCPLGSGSPGAPDTPQGAPGAFRGAGSSAGSSAQASPRASRLGPNDVEYVEFVLDTFELVAFVHVSLSPIRTRVDPALAQAARQRQAQAGEAAVVASAAATVSAAPPTGASLALCSTRASAGTSDVDLPVTTVCA